MTEQTTSVTAAPNVLVVERFFTAMKRKDFKTVDDLLADDLVYENVGFPTIRGGRRVAKMFRGIEGIVDFDVKIHRSAVDGVTVINERHDMIGLKPLRLKFWVCGVFEVHDGRITLWRDYFDTFEFFVKAPVRGLIGILIPSLQPRL